ncbi:hypothetical protein KKZ69_11565 [Enterobacter hormaechei subsp. hoffmannii]|nr:hypothetical protein [Enterobacter hormaechei subsp. hoffmannii]
MTTNQTERVSDEELDQMIWKLERDGMTPKQLSLMRELREVRRAKGEPVARELQEHHEAVSTPIYQLFDMGWYDTNKQTHDNAVSAGCAGRIVYTAPPAPVSVPAAMEMDDDFDSAFEHGKAVGWNACRAAMLQGADGTLTNEGTIPVTQFNPVADLYGLTSPTGGETSFTFDAVEARDFIDGGWSCQEYVELGRFQEAMLQNGNSPAQSDCCPEQNYIAPAQDGNSPVIPDGLRLALSNAGIAAPESDEMLAATYEKHIQALVTWVKDRKPFKSAVIPDGWVLVPVEPTPEMINSAMLDNETGEVAEIYELMLAAAPQQEDL